MKTALRRDGERWVLEISSLFVEQYGFKENQEFLVDIKEYLYGVAFILYTYRTDTLESIDKNNTEKKFQKYSDLI